MGTPLPVREAGGSRARADRLSGTTLPNWPAGDAPHSGHSPVAGEGPGRLTIQKRAALQGVSGEDLKEREIPVYRSHAEVHDGRAGRTAPKRVPMAVARCQPPEP